MSKFIGVDVGTGSARAALVTSDGEILAESTYATTTWRDERNADIFEQSTVEIWNCISKACKDVVREAKIDPSEVKGIGFDATCSLAVADTSGRPMSVSPGQWGVGDEHHNIILWADHRAVEEAATINASGSHVLKYVGGTMSLEMELPKILWLKKHMPAELFEQSTFFDLPDFLGYLATGELARSNCSLACKCSYVPPGVDGSEGWHAELMEKIGLGSIVKRDFEQIGGRPHGQVAPGKPTLILTAGQPIGKGLSAKAAAELGLVEGTPVGSCVIDAYAGWAGTVAAPMDGQDPSFAASSERLAAIAGTSTCHIVQSDEPVFVPGVWGPYLHALYPDKWMNEGGQSSTGQLIDFMIETHPAWPQLQALAKQQGKNHFVLLGELLKKRAEDTKAPFLSYLNRNLFFYPDLHGNRSPLARSDMRGMYDGMALDKTLTDLCIRYLATCEAIALQTRQIVEAMNSRGHTIKAIFMSGGLVKNPVLMQLLADVCSMPVQLPASASASVVLGSAMLGAAAGHPDEVAQGPITTQEQASERARAMTHRLWDVMVKMSRPGTTVKPRAEGKEKALLDAKYKVFLEQIECQIRWRKSTAAALASEA